MNYMELMNDLEAILASGLGIFIVGLLVLNFILWMFLPFAIFGVKKRLDTGNEINSKILTELISIDREVSRISGRRNSD